MFSTWTCVHVPHSIGAEISSVWRCARVLRCLTFRRNFIMNPCAAVSSGNHTGHKTRRVHNEHGALRLKKKSPRRHFRCHPDLRGYRGASSKNQRREEPEVYCVIMVRNKWFSSRLKCRGRQMKSFHPAFMVLIRVRVNLTREPATPFYQHPSQLIIFRLPGDYLAGNSVSFVCFGSLAMFSSVTWFSL